MIVLDASAVLSVLFDEPGADHVASQLGDATISSVNLAEVVSKLVDRAASNGQIAAVVSQFEPMCKPLSTDCAVVAGKMRQATRASGLSLGDRCCLALAYELGLKVLTADRAWKDLEMGIDIEVIR